jgi:hypothetical protein
VTKEAIITTLKKHRLDLIVVASLLLFSLVTLLTFQLTRKEGARAEVTIDGAVVAEYPLTTDATYTLNGGTNTLTVKDGVAYMTYSSCPDHTCERTGKVKYVGEQIVCLPNKLSIKIVGTSDDAVDFIP